MALTLCHECGKQISTEAKACPGCGAPANAIRQRLAEVRVQKGLPSTRSAEEERRANRRTGFIAFGVILVALWAFGIGDFGSSVGGKTAAEKAAADQEHRESEAITFAKAGVRARLRDPGSAEFLGVRAVTSHDSIFVCGQVNAKNGFGGMTGAQRFVAYGEAAVLADDVKSLGRVASSLLDKCGR